MITILRRNLNVTYETHELDNGDIETVQVKIPSNVIYNNIFINNNNCLTLDISIITPFKTTVDRTIKIPITENIGKILDVAAVVTTSRYTIEIFSAYELIDPNHRRLKFPANASDFLRIARIVIESPESIYVAAWQNSEEVLGVTNMVIDTSETMSGALARLSDVYNKASNAVDIKYRMIKETDIYKSAAYLEAQLDVLTRLVISLAPESDLLNVLKIADKYSVLNIKPKEDILNEFTHSKGNLRRMQEDYYVDLKGTTYENISS